MQVGETYTEDKNNAATNHWRFIYSNKKKKGRRKMEKIITVMTTPHMPMRHVTPAGPILRVN